jgi:putative tryptophan/tyrosine transport system substrate-binding protein
MLSRRLFRLSIALASIAWASNALSQPARLPRVAVLGMDTQMQAVQMKAFYDRLRAVGYEDGRTVIIEYRSAEGRFDRLPELAAELVALNPDVLVTAAPPAVIALQKATTTIPTVMVVHDPIGYGFVETLARPGRNITGLAFQDSELSAKRIDLLRQFIPNLSRLTIIWNRAGGGPNTARAMEDAARSIGAQVQTIEVSQPSDLAQAVAAAKAWSTQGIIQLASPIITKNRHLIIEAAALHRIPMMCELRMYVVDGCLATYSASLPSMFTRLADYVDRILRGARPENLPIEQPREFEFVINEGVAERLGLKITPTLRVQATEIFR